jgi:hypothetical protein
VLNCQSFFCPYISRIRRRDAIATPPRPLTPPKSTRSTGTQDVIENFGISLYYRSSQAAGQSSGIATKCHTCRGSPQLRVSIRSVEDLRHRRVETESSVSVLSRELGIPYLMKRLYRQLEHSRFQKPSEYVSLLLMTTWIFYADLFSL